MHETKSVDLQPGEAILATWRTTSRVTEYLVEHLPEELWAEKVPGAPRRTIRMIAGHVHNARCMWAKMLGKSKRVPVPKGVDRHRVTRTQLLAALPRSAEGISRLLEIGLRSGGRIVDPKQVPWLNFPPDVAHFLAYFVAHEAHHRGQIVMLARQLGHRLPSSVTTGLWQWHHRSRETREGG